MPRGKQRTRLRGIVTSTKMDKTVVVVVERRTRHPLYPKFLIRRKSFPAHDEQNRCKQGDLVEIVSSRPFSKTKKWAVTGVVKSADSLIPETPSNKE